MHLKVSQSFALIVFLLNMRTTDKIHVRSYIKTRGALNKPASEIYRELCEVYGTSIVSFSTVCRWLSKFKNGTNVINDAARSGRPKTATTKVNIAAVKRLVDEDSRYTLKYMASATGVSLGKVHEILTKHLMLRKICARWVPHLLTDAQKAMGVKIA